MVMSGALLASMPAPAAFPVTMEVDAEKSIGALPPIWRFFGADEPNYANRPEGDRLLSELGKLLPGRIYFRLRGIATRSGSDQKERDKKGPNSR
jgi:xylan 1,4-beta-xylosidase